MIDPKVKPSIAAREKEMSTTHKYTFLGYDIATSNRTSKSHLLRFGTKVTLCGKDAGWSDWQHKQNAAPFDEATDCRMCLKAARNVA